LGEQPIAWHLTQFRMIWSKGSPVQAMFQYGGKVRSQWRSVTDPQKCLNKAIRHLHSFSRLLNIPTAALPVGPSIQKEFLRQSRHHTLVRHP
jgi:hypothetical protein